MVSARQLYAVGFGLAILGGLGAAAGLALAGSPGSVLVLVAVLPLVFGLASTVRQEPVDWDHSLAYRVGNVCGALVAVALGLVMLAVGVVSLGLFG